MEGRQDLSLYIFDSNRSATNVEIFSPCQILNAGTESRLFLIPFFLSSFYRKYFFKYLS